MLSVITKLKPLMKGTDQVWYLLIVTTKVRLPLVVTANVRPRLIVTA